MENFEVDKDFRGEKEDLLADALRNTNLIAIVQAYTGQDTGICVDIIKACTKGDTTVAAAIDKFIEDILGE